MTTSGLYRDHAQHVWGICYRMTGSAADADDLTQDTFVRAIDRPPANTDDPWRPWLTTVAMNLARDRLRARKRQGYLGAWLPAPVATGEAASPDDPASRYDMVESVSMGFLLALEALSTRQRAVLVLRDVLDYSGKETGAALGMSETHVKVTLLRARRAMESYDHTRRPPTGAVQQETREVLERFTRAIAHADASALESMLAASVQSINDGGGEYHAALRPVLGPDRVTRFQLGVAKKGGIVTRARLEMLNGLPALIVGLSGGPGYAPLAVLQCEADAAGKVSRVYTVLAPTKVAPFRFESVA